MNSLTMVFKTNDVIDGIIDISAASVRLQQQLERDLSGVTIPMSWMVTESSAQKSLAQGAKSGPQPVAEPKKEVAGEQNKNRFIFFATQKDKNTDVLTFITTNPLASFWSDSGAGKAKSRLARVVYRLESDKDNPLLFKLMRQEGMDLDFKNYESGAKKVIRPLEVTRGIKDFSLRFMVEDEPEKKEEVSKIASTPGKGSVAPVKDSVEQRKTIKYKTLDEWRDEEKKDEKERKKEFKIPRFVQLKLTLIDTKKNREEEFEYIFPIACDGEPFSKKEVAAPQQNPAQPVQQGGIRQRLAQASGRPKTRPGGLLGQFTQGLGVRV